MEEDATQVSEFNSNLASLQRIDTILKQSAVAEFNEDYIGYFKHLRNLRKEARYKMNGKYKTTKTEDDLRWNKMENHYTLFMNNQKSINLRTAFSGMLHNYELFLRDFMGQKGMLLADKQDDSGL